MIVAVITAEKASELQGKEFRKDEQYGPVEIPGVGWIISLTEAQYLTTGDIVELIDYEAPEQQSEA